MKPTSRPPAMPKSASPAPGEAEVGAPPPPGPVHRTAHDGNLEGLRVVAQPPLDLDGQILDADVVAAAGRAGDHHRATLAQAECLEDLPADLDLLDRVGR